MFERFAPMRPTRFLAPALAFLALLALAPTPALACGSGATLDGDVGAAAAIVEGRIGAGSPRPELRSGQTGPKGGSLDPYVPVEFSVRVDRPIKGTVTDPFVFFARADRAPGGQAARGAGGALVLAADQPCGWPAGDPSGAYAVLLLTTGYGNRLVALRSSALFAGPDDPALAAFRAEVASRLPAATTARVLPAPRGADAAPDVLTGALVGVPLTMLAGAALLLVRVGPRRPRADFDADGARHREPEAAPA